jgi:hypothetical protein
VWRKARSLSAVGLFWHHTGPRVRQPQLRDPIVDIGLVHIDVRQDAANVGQMFPGTAFAKEGQLLDDDIFGRRDPRGELGRELNPTTEYWGDGKSPGSTAAWSGRISATKSMSRVKRGSPYTTTAKEPTII